MSVPATITAREVAKWFVGAIDRERGDSITHLKLQKLIYYAQAWSLALRARPLFNEPLLAWTHGPVAEDVYRDYKHYGWNALPPPDVMPTLNAKDQEHLCDILDAYGDCSAKHLEAMTHAEEPWLEARGDLPLEARCSNQISHETMVRYYRGLYNEQNG